MRKPAPFAFVVCISNLTCAPTTYGKGLPVFRVFRDDGQNAGSEHVRETGRPPRVRLIPGGTARLHAFTPPPSPTPTLSPRETRASKRDIYYQVNQEPEDELEPPGVHESPSILPAGGARKNFLAGGAGGPTVSRIESMSGERISDRWSNPAGGAGVASVKGNKLVEDGGLPLRETSSGVSAAPTRPLVAEMLPFENPDFVGGLSGEDAGVSVVPEQSPVPAIASMRPLAAEVLPFDASELEGFTEVDARQVFGPSSTFQVIALDYFVTEVARLDPTWVSLKEERRQRLAEWAATPQWKRGSMRRKKSWAEKGIDFLLCGIRRRVVFHRDEGSSCTRSFTVPEYCRLRGCPRCGEIQADDFYNHWIARLLGVAKYHPLGARPGKRWGYEFYHITLTSKKPETRPTPAESTVLWKDFLTKVGRFCRAFYPGSPGKSELYPKRDGCGTLSQGEVGRNKDGTANWNQHAHVIVFGPYNEVATMKAYWTKLTGASGYGVEVKRLGNDPEAISKTLRHMFKYYKKPFSYDPKTYVETLIGMDGVRLRRATGIFYRDQRGSKWADRVADWESCARAELEALGKIPERVLKCFDCGGVLVPNYRAGLLWRTQAFERGHTDYEEARAARGPPRLMKIHGWQKGTGAAGSGNGA